MYLYQFYIFYKREIKLLYIDKQKYNRCRPWKKIKSVTFYRQVEEEARKRNEN